MVFIKKILLVLVVLILVFSISGCKKESKDYKDSKDKDIKDSKNDEIDSSVVWTYDIGGDAYVYYSTPALSQDEQTLYIGTSKKLHSPQSENDRLIALSTDGKLKWEYDTNKGEVRSNIVVYKDYIFFVADYEKMTDPKRKIIKEKK